MYAGWSHAGNKSSCDRSNDYLSGLLLWCDRKNRPAVPADWLKEEWRKRGLLKRFQLTVSGCVGPCDLPNVVVVNSQTGSQWLGHITEFNQYRSLLEWAVRSVDAGHLLELPREFKDHLMEPWR